MHDWLPRLLRITHGNDIESSHLMRKPSMYHKPIQSNFYNTVKKLTILYKTLYSVLLSDQDSKRFIFLGIVSKQG